MFIKYNPKDPHVKTIPVVAASDGNTSVSLANNSVILRPGTNELTESEWKAIQPHIKDEITKKIIVAFTVEVKKAGGVMKARTLKDVPVSVARKIIESCQNVADLKKWVRQELPDEIMLLVLKRLRKFKIDPDEFADDIDGEDDDLDADITPVDDSGPEVEPAPARRGRKKSGGRNGGSGNPAPADDGDGPEGGELDGEEDDEDEIPDFDGSGGEE